MTAVARRDGFDVAIIGAGPAGTATAIALAGKGRSVILIERSRYEAPRIGETLPPRARLTLARLGVWERFIRARHLPSTGTLAAWGSPKVSVNDMIFNPYGCGWHLDRARFDKMLARRAAQAGARVCRGARVTNLVRDEAKVWRIESEAGVHHARLLVDATGRMALVARRLGIPRLRYDRLVGVAGFTTASGQDSRTLVEAVREGWWYSALLPDARLIVAFMTDADLLPVHKSELLAFWEMQLAAARHTCERVGAALEGPLRIFAADSSRLDRSAGKDWLAVGDAAHALDPLSSQGIEEALESGLRGGEALEKRLRGNSRGMREYAAWGQRQFSRYLEQRANYYRQEERWPDAPFWKRRHGLTAAAAPLV